jgi:Uma2 family endonuclease
METLIAMPLLTAEEFWMLADQPEYAEKRLELDDGELEEMAGSKPLNTITAVRIATFMNLHVIQHDLGYVAGADSEFKLAPRIVRQPDVAFIAKHRLPQLPRRFELAPDLAVEIVSENEDVLKKVYEYLRTGGEMVWAVYPEERQVHVFTMTKDGILQGRTFGIEDVLDGGTVLPNFKLAVKDIFPQV